MPERKPFDGWFYPFIVNDALKIADKQTFADDLPYVPRNRK
jgi:hypothetical protein